jgi:nucleotide sugar dehydrogenase
MKIGLIGAGRLGICLALLIEQEGYHVIASDVREDYIKDLQNKKINSTEPQVQELLEHSINLEFTTDNRKVIRESDIIFTLVQTPSLEDGSYDVSAVWEVVEDIKKEMSGIANYPKSFVVGCTTNPGDCDQFKDALPESVDVYYNPEFIAQGSIVDDLRHADMVLLGGKGQHSGALEMMYYQIQNGFKVANVHTMSTRAAELTKIAVNCYLTTKITYANQVGQVMIRDGMEDEVKTVLKAIGGDSRIGTKYLNYGFGFGGPCFPRDNRAFAAYASKAGVETPLGATTDKFNDEHTEFLKEYFINKNKDNHAYVFHYLTYKDGVDILTESRPYDLALSLLDAGYEVYCLDSTAKDRIDSRIKFSDFPRMDQVCYVNL